MLLKIFDFLGELTVGTISTSDLQSSGTACNDQEEWPILGFSRQQ